METQSVSLSKDELGRDMINEYCVVRELGRGSFGVVRLCEHLPSGRFYAVKEIGRKKRGSLFQIPYGEAQENDYERALRREVAVLKRLQHRNVIALKEVIDDSTANVVYLVLQYAARGALVSEGPVHGLPENVVRKHARGMLSALAHMHAAKVVRTSAGDGVPTCGGLKGSPHQAPRRRRLQARELPFGRMR